MKKSGKKIEQTKPVLLPGVIDQNAETLAREITWFVNLVNKKLMDFFPADKLHLRADKEKTEIIMHVADPNPAIVDFSIPDLNNDHSVYSDFVTYYKLNADERLILILALIPYVQPHLLDAF